MNMKNAIKYIMFCTLCITLNACSGGGGSGAGGSSNSNNQQQQSPDNGAENLTPSEIANVEACKEKLQITIVENGSSRSATPGEIAAQGYLISKKCGFSEAELELYLKIQGY